MFLKKKKTSLMKFNVSDEKHYADHGVGGKKGDYVRN